MAGRVIVKGSFTNVSASARFTATLTASIASSSITDDEGRHYAVTGGEILSQPVQGTFDTATKTWTVAVVPVAGVIYRISAPGFMPDCFVESAAFLPMPANADVVVNADSLVGLPGGDVEVEYVTLTTVIASIDSKVASAVEDYLTEHPPGQSKVDKNTIARRVADYDTFAAALSAASSAAGGTVLVDPGQPDIPAATIPTRLTIRASGAGAVLTPVAASAIFLQTAPGAEQVTLEGLTIDLAGKATSYGIQVSTGTKRFVMRGCKVTDTGVANTLIELREGVEDVLIEDCEFSGVFTDGIRLNKDVKRVRIRNCLFTGWKGRAVYGLSSTGYAPSDIVIEGNTVRDPAPLVAGDSRQPISFQGVDSDPFRDIAIINNTVVGNGRSWTDPTNPGVADLISVHRARGVRVIGNTLREGGDGGITIAMQCDGVVVEGNHVEKTDSVGIFIGSGTTAYTRNVSIHGNAILNCGQSRMGDRADHNRGGIWVYNASRMSISGNTFGDNQATATMRYGLMLRTGTSQVDITGNHYSGCSLGKVYRDTTVSGVRYGTPETVYKPAPTVRNNTSTLADDPHLTVAVDPNATYIVEAMIAYAATTSADLRMQWTGPAGASYLGSPDAVASGDSSGGGGALIDRRGISLAAGTSHGGAGGQSLIARPVGRLTTAAAGGAFTLQWAQQTAEASDATVFAGSWIRLTRLA